MPGERGPKLMETLGSIVEKIKENGVIRVAESNLLKTLPVHGIALEAAPEKKKDESDPPDYVKFRIAGNYLFKQGIYVHACNMYTMSIAETLQGPPCALAYANRSAALFHMCKFEECLEDIQRAISNGYEEKLMYKLYLRRARCLKMLGKDFRESYNIAHKMIEQFNKEDMPNLKEALENELEQPVHENPRAGLFYSTGKVPPLSYGISEEVPCFSSAITVAYSKELGRHLIANRDIEIGDVLIVEEPLAAVVDMDKAHKMCCRCLKISFSLIPCNSCQKFMYCGRKCLDLDWEEGHKDECIMLAKVLNMAEDLSKEDVFLGYKKKEKYTLPCLALALMVRNIGFSKMKEAVLSNEAMSESYLDPRTRGFKDGKFTFSLEALLSLTSNFDKLSSGETERLMAYAIDNVMQVPDWDDNREAMTALFIKLYLICTFNYKPIGVFTNYDPKKIKEGLANGSNKVPLFFQCEFGFALYLASSLINHSCCSNMIRVNYGKTVVYRAIRPIKKGEQLTEHFYIYRLSMDLKERQEILKKYYKFDCTCEACKNDWPRFKKLKGFKEDDLSRKDSNFIASCSRLTGDNSIFTEDQESAVNIFIRIGFPADVQLMPKFISVLSKMHAHPDCEQFAIYHHYKSSLINHYFTLGGAVLSKTALDLFTCKHKEKFGEYVSPHIIAAFLNRILVETHTFLDPI